MSKDLACAWYLADGSFECSDRGGIMEAFTQQLRHDPRKPYHYSLAYVLTYYDEAQGVNRVIARETIPDFTRDAKTEIKRINITEHAHKTVPMRLLLTDLTDYGAGQPLLALFLAIDPTGGGPTIRMPAVFRAGNDTSLVKNRQMDIPLPPLNALTLEFDTR